MAGRISFSVQLEPVAKARPRVTKSGYVYTPQKTMFAEYIIHQTAQDVVGVDNTPLFPKPAAVRGEIVFYVKKPKNPKNREHPVTKPDIENLAKTVLDACVRVIYDDDSQIVDLSLKKCYYNGAGKIEIMFEEVD